VLQFRHDILTGKSVDDLGVNKSRYPPFENHKGQGSLPDTTLLFALRVANFFCDDGLVHEDLDANAEIEDLAD
jgi:hypothetical protein